MLRVLFIENGKKTKAKNFKALNIGKIILKIMKSKVCLMVKPLLFNTRKALLEELLRFSNTRNFRKQR